ncbi:MAG: tripartite tricarboxylate transporter TctB family protein [Vicinamibacterales bacterium]
MRKFVNPSMQHCRVDRWLGASLTLLALVWLWLVRIAIPDVRLEGEPGPRGFPLLLGVVLAGLGVWMVVQSVRLKPDTTYAERSDTIAPPTRREVGFAGGTFALLILYAFLLDKLGFLVGTPVVIALAMLGLLRIRTWTPVVSLALGFTFGCWLIFDALLGTPLPRGAWMAWL